MMWWSTKNEAGISLVEVLATIVIAGIIMTAIMSFHTFIQKQAHEDTAVIQSLNDVSIAFASMTKNLRMANPSQVTKIEGDEVGLTIHSMASEIETTYRLDTENHTLLKNNVPYIYDVQTFDITIDMESIQIALTMTKGKTLHTKIMKRRGSVT